MKKIKKLVCMINDELDDAQKYAEKYVDRKAYGDSMMAQKYKEMANDELKHASYIHDEAIDVIQKYKAVYNAPEEMLDKWDDEHALYIERSNWIKYLLTQ